jgi:hypothetical protein
MFGAGLFSPNKYSAQEIIYGQRKKKKSNRAGSKRRRRLAGKRRNSTSKMKSLSASVKERLQIKEGL